MHKPQEFIVKRASTKGIPVERNLDCKCGITIRTSCNEVKCPTCNTILIDSIDNQYSIFSYEKNKNYIEQFVDWVIEDAENLRQVAQLKLN